MAGAVRHLHLLLICIGMVQLSSQQASPCCRGVLLCGGGAGDRPGAGRAVLAGAGEAGPLPRCAAGAPAGAGRLRQGLPGHVETGRLWLSRWASHHAGPAHDMSANTILAASHMACCKAALYRQLLHSCLCRMHRPLNGLPATAAFCMQVIQHTQQANSSTGALTVVPAGAGANPGSQRGQPVAPHPEQGRGARGHAEPGPLPPQHCADL